jgi:predicted glycogen debranching enzyme
MIEPVRFMPWPEESGQPEREDIHPEPLPETLLTREWLITNGLGGYASGTLAAVPTRRYHGLLVAALPSPLGRTLMLGQVQEVLHLPDGTIVSLGGEQYHDQTPQAPGASHLREFRLEWGLPLWSYEAGDFRLEKRVFLVHLQNTVRVLYRLTAGEGRVRLELHPMVHFRPHDAPVSTPLGGAYKLTACEDRYELCSPWPSLPPLRLSIDGRNPTFTVAPRTLQGIYYQVEARRGYESVGDLWTPGFLGADLSLGEDAVALTASTEPWEAVQALRWEEALAAERERRRRLVSMADPRTRGAAGSLAAELVLAADAFVVTPGRAEDAARAHAAGDEARSIIAGYHWFTDWGRDTMISLEGLTLTTGRHLEAGYILRTFVRHVRDGLIPNLFPEGDREGLYHTADATLWFFHALQRYLQATGDLETLRLLLPTLLDIVSHHLGGTRFGIGVDPEDGLLRQGAEGYQLTWMDAKVALENGDSWVVTPRRGKAVELNALWYNALKLLEGWAREHGGATGQESARNLAHHAERCRESFNRRFWYAEGGYLYDVVDGVVAGMDGVEPGDDPACRPNQVFAIALDHPVLDRERWEPVMNVVAERLLTPVGLRSLAPGHPDYKPTYDGDLRSRDAAYHQGTVWGWLIGPYVDAWLKLHPGDPAGARTFLQGFLPHLGEACLGSISEVFDAEEPYTPRGCVAQAWSVAEVLRCWVKTAPSPEPARQEAVPEEAVVAR